MAKLLEEIAELESILNDPAKLRGRHRQEMGRSARSSPTTAGPIITHDPGDMNVEDLVDDEELVVTMSRAGYIKAVSADAFRTQGRGGRGVQGAKLKEEDLIDDVVHTSSHAHLLLFSNRGRVFRLRALEIPMKERTARGTAIVNLLPLAPNESIQAIIGTRDFSADNYLVFATKLGQVKKTAFSEYDKSRREGSSPSTCATATSWCGWWRPTATTTSSW
jgi:DNA gyrase subunit A